jgi:hypothetical protein
MTGGSVPLRFPSEGDQIDLKALPAKGLGLHPATHVPEYKREGILQKSSTTDSREADRSPMHFVDYYRPELLPQ